MIIKRGDILLVDLEPVKGSEQGRVRPCLVVQNDMANRFSPNTIVVPFTTTVTGKDYPVSLVIEPEDSGLNYRSTLLCAQLRAISVAHRVRGKLGALKPQALARVDAALKESLGLD